LTIFGQIIANLCLNMVKSSIFMDYIMLFSRGEGSRDGGHEKDVLLNCGDKRGETRRGSTKKKNVSGDVLIRVDFIEVFTISNQG